MTLTKNKELAAAEIEQLEQMNAAGVEKWIQANGNELDELTAATRSRNLAAHAILDRKNREEHQAKIAGRGPDHPKTQRVGIQQ